MKKNLTLLLLAASALMLVRCGSGTEKSKEQKDEKKEAYESATTGPDSLCIVTPSWFPHSQTPPPAEGKGSPFDVSSTTNQIFHQWSWNKFLWLTKPDAGGNPLFLNQLLVRQVTPYMAALTPQAGTLVVLQDSNQAGSGNPILRTNAGYGGTSQTVYYSIHMNDLMYVTALKYAQQISKGTLPANNLTAFPVGSFELKVSWVPLTSIPSDKQSMYYTTTASLSYDGGKTYTKTPVAMLGMHVVGVVENHPEFIWATFEHQDLSPDYDWKANSASAATDMLLFKKGTVSGIDGIRYNTSTQLGVLPYQVFDLFQYGVPVDSTGNFMVTSQSEPVNFNNVQGINQCVQGQLNDVWKNYFYNGSIWLNMDGKTPEQQAQLIDSLGYNMTNATPGSYARGSMNCANVTMESFTQTFQSSINNVDVTTLANCFSCHAGVSFSNSNNTSPLYLSHVFQDYLEQSKGASVKAVEMLKAKVEDNMVKRLRK